MANHKSKLLLLLIPIVIGGTAALLHNKVKHIENSPSMKAMPWALATDVVTQGRVEQGFPALGRVVSSSEVRIVPQISGAVLKMGPRQGGLVKKGDLIVHIDTRSLEADQGALQAKLASATAVERNNNKELKREQRLFEQGGSSASAVDQLKTRLNSDKANVRALKKQLESLAVKISYGHIYAPISGRIAQRLAEQGDTVFPGKVIYTITAEQGGRVVVPVPLDTMTRIHADGIVMLTQGQQQLATHITRINPSLDALAMGSLEIDLSERPFNLPDSAPVAAYVLTANSTGLTVPVEALRPTTSTTEGTIFKLIKQPTPHLQQQRVAVTLCGKRRCVIQGDIAAGDHVVTAHGSVLLQLHDGDAMLWHDEASVQP
jgi:RND family efflux transporter MFP subunit